MKTDDKNYSNILKSTPLNNAQRRNPKMRRLFTIVILVGFSLCILLQFRCSSSPSTSQINESGLSEGQRLYKQDAQYASAAVNIAAETEVVPPAYEPEIDSSQNERIVIYNAVINVVVERISDSMNKIKIVVSSMGGYMQEMSSNSITLKIPAARFQDAIAEVENLGEVTRKVIKGSDVTEEMRDLKVRLGNAEQVRDRLIKLLDRAETIEEMLNIEKELERVTEKIELLKGKIQYLQDKTVFSTLTVCFNSPVPQENITIATPFRWVHALGSEMIRPVITQTQHSTFFSNTMFTIPDAYIKYYEDQYRTRAMSASDVLIHSHKEENYKGGNIGFWSSLVRRALVEQKTIFIDKEIKLKLQNKNDAVLYIGKKQIGSKQFGYLIALSVTKKNIYIFEAWGPSPEFDKDLNKLEAAVKSMRLK
jgi:hypothetical protein